MPASGAKGRAGNDGGRNAHNREDGFALVVVLAVLSLLALAAIVLQKTVVAELSVTSHLTGRARAEALADGLTRLAVRHLAINAPNGRSGLFRLDGAPLTCRAGSSFASLSFTNTDGQINLNLASQTMLERILQGAGLAPAEATRMAQDIIDFRTTGDQSITGGRKLDAYSQAGLRHGPKSALFQSVGELRQVVGMTPQLFERLRPLLTVHSRFGAINPGAVSLPVARALLGEQAAAQDLDVLQSRLNLPPEFTYIPRTRGTGPTSSNTYLVRVAVKMGTARFTREAIVELTATPNGDATIRSWSERDPDPAGIEPAATEDTPACIGDVLWLDPA